MMILYNGKTALIRAADNGHTDCVKILCEKGADMNIVNEVSEEGERSEYSLLYTVTAYY